MTEATAPEATVVEISVELAAPPAEVWPYLVDPDRMGAWLEAFRFESRWEVGGPLAVVGELHGRPYKEAGTLLALAEGALLRYDHFSRLWRVPDRPEHRAVVELRLTPTPLGCRLDFRHTLPPVLALAEHSRFFWRVSLYQLRRILAGGAPGA